MQQLQEDERHEVWSAEVAAVAKDKSWDRVMYVVENTTGRIVTLSDLRAQIPPFARNFDLEKVAKRLDIESSLDFRRALADQTLKLVPYGVTVRSPTAPVRPELDETKLEEIVQRAVTKAQVKHVAPPPVPQTANIEKAVQDALAPMMERILQKIERAGTGGSDIDSGVDMAKLADLHVKAAEQSQSQVESSQQDARKVKVKPRKDIRTIAENL